MGVGLEPSRAEQQSGLSVTRVLSRLIVLELLVFETLPLYHVVVLFALVLTLRLMGSMISLVCSLHVIGPMTGF